MDEKMYNYVAGLEHSHLKLCRKLVTKVPICTFLIFTLFTMVTEFLNFANSAAKLRQLHQQS